MAIRDENDNKITPLTPQDDEVIKTAIWKFDVEEAMSKVDHGRYEYSPDGLFAFPAGTKTRMLDFKAVAHATYKPHNSMVFIKSSVEQPYNYVGKDNCENACFAVVITKLENKNSYNLSLFGMRDGWLKAVKVVDTRNNQMKWLKAMPDNKAPLLMSLKAHTTPEQLPVFLENLVRHEYRLFMSNDTFRVDAPAGIKTFMDVTGAREEQACFELTRQLNAWPKGVRSHSELLDAVINKVGIEKIESIGEQTDAYLDLLVAKEHWLDMKAANEKGLLYPSGPFSGILQCGECVDPDKMLAMIDTDLNKIMDDIGNPKATIKPLRNQSERGER